MSEPEIIKTLSKPVESIYKEKGSEFIAKAFPIMTENEVPNILRETKKEYYDASHHCYAFRLKDNSFRYSDAGEPSGTAGIRILNAIDHFGIAGILIIVVRYFGGVKLGAGNLGKAYYLSAETLLKNCECHEEKLFRNVIIKSDFNHISLIHRKIADYSAIIKSAEYGENVKFDCLIPDQYLTNFEHELTNLSNGGIKISAGREKIYHSF